MIKKTITYVDYNGNQRTEDFYFNLSKADLLRINVRANGGLVEMMNRLIAAQDTPAMFEIFEDLIRESYGVRTPDGRGFVKRREDYEAFKSSEAYSELLIDLLDADKAAEFFNGVVPAGLVEQAKLEEAKQNLVAAIN